MARFSILPVALLGTLLLVLGSSLDRSSAQAPGPAVCPLCKVPNRAALFAGNAASCPEGCSKTCCTGTEATFVVEGLVCVNCSDKVRAALALLEGVHVVAVCHNTGQALVKYDPAVVEVPAIAATITEAGHPVTGQKLRWHVDDLKKEADARELERTLARIVGVTKIVVSLEEDDATLTVVCDPAKSPSKAVAAAVQQAGFRLRDAR